MQAATKLLCTGVLLLAGGATVHLAAQAVDTSIHACVGPSGTMRIVPAGEVCRTSETPIAWTTGTAGPPPPAAGAAPRVINAYGLELGPLVGPSTAVLTLPTGQKAYADLYPANAPADWTVNQYYETSDCSGEPVVSWMTIEELLPPALVRRSGVWALRPGSLARRALRSWRSVGDQGPSPVCNIFTATFDTWQFDFYTPHQLGIAYPLTVE